MKIEVRTVDLTKSKILQMDYVLTLMHLHADVLGWVNVGEYKYVIIKDGECYYRAQYITNVEKTLDTEQFPAEGDGYIFPHVHHISYTVYKNRKIPISPSQDDNINLNLYDQLVSFKRKTERAGQIYY